MLQIGGTEKDHVFRLELKIHCLFLGIHRKMKIEPIGCSVGEKENSRGASRDETRDSAQHLEPDSMVCLLP